MRVRLALTPAPLTRSGSGRESIKIQAGKIPRTWLITFWDEPNNRVEIAMDDLTFWNLIFQMNNARNRILELENDEKELANIQGEAALDANDM